MPEVPSLGARGEGWVVLQFVVIALVVGACVLGPRWPEDARVALGVVGAVAAVAGAVLAGWPARALGPALTPFPKPASGAVRVERGPYRVVRHPIYAGVLLLFAGLSLALSPLALALTAVLALVWALKIAVEERFLHAAYPAYASYCSRTRWRLVPFVY